MSIDFILPDIGEGIVECELVEWLVAEGETIVEDQPIADVMTDKALVQIPAMHNGTVEKLFYKQGEIAKVHAPLFSMVVDGDTANNEPASTEKVAPVATETHVCQNNSRGTVTEDFILPDIGEGIVECELVEWLVKEGDLIEEDQPIADVMTDKALVQIPAMHKGKVTKLYYEKGEIAKVHSPLFAVEHAGGGTSVAASDAIAEETPNQTEVQTPKAPTATTQQAKQAPVAGIAGANNGKAVASPAVRRVAKELNVNICEVPGSGKKGRVYKEDVVAFNQAPQPLVSEVSTTSTVAVSGGTRVEPIKGIKAVMAKAMVESVSTIPHFTYCDEIDMTELIALRSELKEHYAKQDVKLTMMPFFMKAMSLALNEFPIVNSQVNADCTELTYFDDHNIGMAVDSKVGLLVPNIKSVQTRSIIELANEITRLTNDARSGRVAAKDLKGGTISISNIGAIGGTIATPIINKPESAIVALGKLQKLPRFDENGNVEARSIMQVSWSGDHRTIDGGTIARFCNLWKSYLENPTTMMMNMS